MTKCVYQHIGDDGVVLCDNYSNYAHGIITFCNQKTGCTGKKPTNADRIRAMSDEKLSRWLGDMIYPECVCCPADENGWCEDCYEKWQVWLKQEAES